MKRILVEEAGGACQACGYDRFIGNLVFHHVDPAQKEFPMSTGSGKSLDRFRKEARKCVLLCHNCHGEIEAGLRLCPFPPTPWVPLPVLRPRNLSAQLRQLGFGDRPA